jgi:hypothetical protein
VGLKFEILNSKFETERSFKKADKKAASSLSFLETELPLLRYGHADLASP